MQATEAKSIKTEDTTHRGAPWVPVAGIVYALFCPVSEKDFHPFKHILGYHLYHGPVVRFLGVGEISAGAAFLRLLFVLAFLAAIFHRKPLGDLFRGQAVAAGLYWPLLISTLIIVANSGYAIIWAWLVSVNRLAPHLGRWQWAGVVFGFAVWLLSAWL